MKVPCSCTLGFYILVVQVNENKKTLQMSEMKLEWENFEVDAGLNNVPARPENLLRCGKYRRWQVVTVSKHNIWLNYFCSHLLPNSGFLAKSYKFSLCFIWYIYCLSTEDSLNESNNKFDHHSDTDVGSVLVQFFCGYKWLNIATIAWNAILITWEIFLRVSGRLGCWTEYIAKSSAARSDDICYLHMVHYVRV